MDKAPELCRRTFGFWFNMFSGVVSLCMVCLKKKSYPEPPRQLAIALYVSRAPHVADASMALRQMQTANILFSRVAVNNPRATRAHVRLVLYISQNDC